MRGIGSAKVRHVAVTIGTVLACFALVAAAGAASEGEGVSPTKDWMDLFSYHLTFAGVPAPAGTYVAAFDPQGTQCGERSTTVAGYLAPVMPCYGDNSMTPLDEGAENGDVIWFSVNGVNAAVRAIGHDFEPAPPGTPVTWTARDVWEIDLTAAPQPEVAIKHTPALTTLSWEASHVSVVRYDVWRSEDFYVLPEAEGSALIGSVSATTVPLKWTDVDGAGIPETNYAYRVVSVNVTGSPQADLWVGASQAVAEFDFRLQR